MRMFVPATLAAVAIVLTACDDPSPAAGGKQDSPTTSSPPTSEELRPVNCGKVDVAAGQTHAVVADPAGSGLVGCTEAINVVAEYLQIPAEERGAALDGIDLSAGWRCTTDDGETASIGCVKGTSGDGFELALHTTPVLG